MKCPSSSSHITQTVALLIFPIFAHLPVLVPISFTFYYLFYLHIQSWHLAVNQEPDDRTIYSWYKGPVENNLHNYPLSLLITITINIIIKTPLKIPSWLHLHAPALPSLFCFLFPRRVFLNFSQMQRLKLNKT